MMTNLQSSAFVARTTQLLSSVARLRLLLVMLLTLTVSAEVWADYTIAFKTGSGSEATTKTAIISSGTDYVSTVSASKTYAESEGLRYGSSSAMGYTTFTLSDKGQIKASKIIFQGAKYYSSDNSSLQYTITYTDASTTSGTITLTSTATDKEATLESSKTISEIDIRKTANSKKRFYVQGVTVVAASAAVTTYTVTYDLNGGTGTTPTQANVAAGGTFILAASSGFSKTGYSFAGWNDGTTTYDEGDTYTMPAEAVTLKAQWTELPKYTVTLMDDESTLTQSTAGGSVTLPSREGCKGYTFAGWTKTWTSDQTSWTTTAPIIIPDGSYTPTANENLYPVYTKTETTQGTTTTIDYVLTDLANIKSTDIVVITTYHSTNGTYAMSNNNGTSSAPTAQSVTVSGSKLSADPGSNYKWNISNNNGTLTIYPNGTTATWLYCTSTNNGVRVGTNTNKTFTISTDYLQHTGTSRYLGVYNQQDWRCYTSTTTNIGSQTLKFYVETTTTTSTSTTTTSYISVPDCSTETTVSVLPKIMKFQQSIFGVSSGYLWGKTGYRHVPGGIVVVSLHHRCTKIDFHHINMSKTAFAAKPLL